MLISTDLPINRDRFAQNDQILTITGANWLDYQNFDSQEYPGYRVSYFNSDKDLPDLVVEVIFSKEARRGFLDKSRSCINRTLFHDMSMKFSFFSKSSMESMKK